MRSALVLLLALAACLRTKPADTVVETKVLTPREVTAATRGGDRAVAPGATRCAASTRSTRLYAHDPDIVLVADGVSADRLELGRGMLKDRLARAKRDPHPAQGRPGDVARRRPLRSAVATMTRELGDGVTTVTENGSLTLVLRKDRTAGWVIVGEHYSYKRPG